MKIKRSVLQTGVFVALTAGTTLPAQVPSSGLTLATARVETVDCDKRLVELRIRERYYLYRVSPHLTETRTRSPLRLDALSTGERIRFICRPTSDQGLEIVSLVILHTKSLTRSGGGSATHDVDPPSTTDDGGGSPGAPSVEPPPSEVSPFE